MGTYSFLDTDQIIEKVSLTKKWQCTRRDYFSTHQYNVRPYPHFPIPIRKLEKATGMTIPEIFAAEGEEGFRKVEMSVLDAVHAYVRCVVSTGGGIVLRTENWGKMQTGIVVWLDVPPEVIYERVKGTDRPLLQTEDPLRTIRDIMENRRDKYSQADLTIQVSSDMDETTVVDLVIRQLHDFIDEHPPAWKIAKAKAQANGLDWVK
jgi:shikimate kinase